MRNGDGSDRSCITSWQSEEHGVEKTGWSLEEGLGHLTFLGDRDVNRIGIGHQEHTQSPSQKIWYWQVQGRTVEPRNVTTLSVVTFSAVLISFWSWHLFSFSVWTISILPSSQNVPKDCKVQSEWRIVQKWLYSRYRQILHLSEWSCFVLWDRS